jgi:hypothetical protein
VFPGRACVSRGLEVVHFWGLLSGRQLVRQRPGYAEWLWFHRPLAGLLTRRPVPHSEPSLSVLTLLTSDMSSRHKLTNGKPGRIVVVVPVTRALDDEIGVTQERTRHDTNVQAHRVIVAWGQLDSTPVQLAVVNVRGGAGRGTENQIAVFVSRQREVVVTENARDRFERVDDCCLELVDRCVVDVAACLPKNPTTVSLRALSRASRSGTRIQWRCPSASGSRIRTPVPIGCSSSHPGASARRFASIVRITPASPTVLAAAANCRDPTSSSAPSWTIVDTGADRNSPLAPAMAQRLWTNSPLAARRPHQRLERS